ncbi:MAG: hypothetical protein ACTSSB_05380 [Candidatus Heimdallarchaeota archaeon]
MITPTLADRANKLKQLTISESMLLQADLIDTLVKIYFSSLKNRYPSATFEELIQHGHKISRQRIQRSDFHD